MNNDHLPENDLADAVILSVGAELITGEVVDTNTSWLARELETLGIRCRLHVTAPDAVDVVTREISRAAELASLVIVTGGLGPTADDLTRAALAFAAGVELVQDATALASIRAFFQRRGRDMPAENRTQALIPRGGRALRNDCGTAPGVFVKLGSAWCYALPGVPFEMRDMFTRVVRPELAARARGRLLRRRILHCCGMPESRLGDRLADLLRPGRNPAVGTCALTGVIDVRIRADAADEDEARRLLDETEAEVRERLGAVVYGVDDDTLASVVGRLLVARSATLSTAESCTGGLVAKMITDVPGSSRYYLGGGVTYANELKERVVGVEQELLVTHGAVSEPVAKAMAAGARSAFGSDYAVATTGIAGPGGATPGKPVGLVYCAVGTPAGVQVRRATLGDDVPREVVRQRAAYTVLNMLRLVLEQATE